ncbi:MAG: RIP metalloprotease RseP [Polyangiaceae bacterium]|nr:RIP metalloprotease RseP [Polyangiaceae bacterium]
MSDLLYFVVLISTLIFVHELGHFLFAKAFGVKVLVFSIGFGPKLLRIRGGETEYCLSILPVGGYVKFLEESRSDPVLPEDKGRTFESLASWKRIIIVLAGPAMNLAFPVLLYFSVFLTDGPFQPPTVGVVLPEHPAAGLLEPGDRIMAINGKPVGTFVDVRRVVERSAGETLRFQVFRRSRHEEVEVVVQEKKRQLDFELSERYGTIGIQPNAPSAVIGIQSPNSPAYRAGLRSFDVVTFVEGRPIDRFMDLELALENNHGVTTPVTYLRPHSVRGSMGGLADFAVYEAGVVSLTPDPQGRRLFQKTGIESADLYVRTVPRNSALGLAGIEPGDRLVALDGQVLPAWSTFVDRLKSEPQKEHQLLYISSRTGRKKEVSFRLREEVFAGADGQVFRQPILPCGSWANLVRDGQSGCSADSVQQWLPLSLEERVAHPYPIRYAFSRAIESTTRVTRFIMTTLTRLAQGKTSLQEMSGPIAIYEIAGREGRKGADYFVWVMAVISINLGFLNLLPIPALDGGQLVFIVLEMVIRRPLPTRFREVAHIFGMLFLLLLMGIAFKNDVSKRWPGLAQGLFPEAQSSSDEVSP